MGTKTNPSPTYPMFPGGAVSVTPSDSVNLANPSVIYVGTAGAVKVTTTQGDAVTFNGAQDGQVLPVSVIRVWSTGTTATNILAIY